MNIADGLNVGYKTMFKDDSKDSDLNSLNSSQEDICNPIVHDY